MSTGAVVLLVVVVVLALVVAMLVLLQLSEIRRYLRMKKM